MFLEEDGTLDQEQVKGQLKWQETTENRVLDNFKPAEDDWIPAKYGEQSAMDPKKEQDLQWLIDKKMEEKENA